MSASLVGSEMCIRDSYRSARNALPARPRFTARALAIHCRRARTPRPAVSYTHLTLPTICSV
eukprot:8668583-Alexandrium_andersonii.AAC.1